MVLAVLTASLAVPSRCRAAGLIGADYQLNWDQTVDRTDQGTKNTWTLKQTLDVKYAGFLSPIVQNEITMKVEQQVKSEGDPRNMLRLNPTITLGYKGSYWAAGAKRTIDDSNELGRNTKVTDSYFVELLYAPARESLPDLKGKYTLDTDSEAGTTDTKRHSLTFSSVDRPHRWLELKGDYTRNWMEDLLKPDSDTRDEKFSGAIGIRHILTRKIRINSEFKVENSTAATLLTAGGTTNDKHDQTYDWKNAVTYLPFRGTTVDGSYDWQLKQNIQTSEHDYLQNIKVAVGQMITEHLDVKGDFTRTVNEIRHTADDNRKTDDTWTVDVKPKLTELFSLTFKWQKKDTTEVHFADPTKNTTSGTVSQSAAWNAVLTRFWRGSATYDRTDTITREVTTTIEKKYGLRSTFEFTRINVILDPSYDIVLKDDRGVTPPVDSATRDFKFKIAWKPITTRNIEAKMDHTYGRREDTSVPNVQRTDTSNVNVVWVNPFPNWNFGVDVVRSATDTSGDDLAPDITSSFTFKADYKYEWLTVNTSYKYDRRKLSDDGETIDFKWGWTAPRWALNMTYTFTKTFSALLKEGYTLGIAFKYNL